MKIDGRRAKPIEFDVRRGPKKSHPIRNTLVLLGVTTGAVVAYAKFDPNFRKQVEEISPTFNEFIKLATQEERSYEESFNIVSNYVTSL